MERPSARPPGTISLATATSLTLANMVGTGVFTTLGFQAQDITSGFCLLLVWALGGVFALCGALSYGELAAALPRSGGEYHLLSRIYHPAVGFLSGWLSVTVGFAAPIALAAMAFGRYFSRVVPGVSPVALSCTLTVLVTLAHLRNLRLGSTFQNAFTLFKVLLVVVFVGAAATIDDPAPIRYLPHAADLHTVFSAPFAIALLFVMYSYSGWNASTYVVNEVRRPAHNVPRSLVLGTTSVLILYVAVNWAFLHAAPLGELAGKVEVGHVAASRIFGPGGGRIMSALLSVALVSTISAMVWTGPRITQVMGEDYAFFRSLARTNAAGIPVRAVLLQSTIVLLLLVTSTFERVLVYIQMMLTASSFLTVLGVLYLRRKEPERPRPYRTWGYPVTPLLFLALSLFTMGYTLRVWPVETLAGAATLLLGLPIYLLTSRREPAPD